MSKPAKSKIIVLKLASESLRTFPHEPTVTPVKAKTTPAHTPAPQIVEPPPADAADAAADSTSAMNGTGTPSSTAPKRKGPASKKRSLATAEGTTAAKPARARPGPKAKKQKTDAPADPNNKTAAPMAAPKLGPKANQGAINANLRSLDRTGKFKVRKWEKRPLHLRSFTGIVWQVPSYIAPPKGSGFSDDVRSDSTGSTETLTPKLKEESSAVSADGATPHPPLFNECVAAMS
jgi:hypothetical protein